MVSLHERKKNVSAVFPCVKVDDIGGGEEGEEEEEEEEEEEDMFPEVVS